MPTAALSEERPQELCIQQRCMALPCPLDISLDLPTCLVSEPSLSTTCRLYMRSTDTAIHRDLRMNIFTVHHGHMRFCCFFPSASSPPPPLPPPPPPSLFPPPSPPPTLVSEGRTGPLMKGPRLTTWLQAGV